MQCNLWESKPYHFFYLWWILSYIEMKQPWVYMCSPSQSPLPPPSPPIPSRFSQYTRSEHLSHASNLGWWSKTISFVIYSSASLSFVSCMFFLLVYTGLFHVRDFLKIFTDLYEFTVKNNVLKWWIKDVWVWLPTAEPQHLLLLRCVSHVWLCATP